MEDLSCDPVNWGGMHWFRTDGVATSSSLDELSGGWMLPLACDSV